MENFFSIYEITKNKLETDIKNQIRKSENHSTIIHDLKVAEMLKEECQKLGYSVSFLPKSRTFTVKWV